MSVPFTFATASGNIALSKLDSNFNTPITIGNTSVLLGNTITTLNNMTLANVTITSGSVVSGNVTSATIANATIANAIITDLTLTNALTVPNGGTGRVTFPVNNVLLGNGTGSFTSVDPGTTGNILVSKGGSWVSNAFSTNFTGIAWSNSTGVLSNVVVGNGLSFSTTTGVLIATGAGANAVTSIGNTYPILSTGGTTPNISFISPGTAGNVLTSIGGIWVSNAATSGSGTVTSVSGTGTVNGISLSGTVTTSGNLTLGGALSGVSLTSQVGGTLPVANGGTGVTASTGTGSVVLNTSPTLTTPVLISPALGTPTSGSLVATTNIPVANATGTLAVANGGTGLTSTPANGALDIGNGSGFTRTTLTAGTNVTITNGAGSITIAASGGGGGTPGGSNTQVQFNNSSSFGGDANLTFSGSTLTSANLIVSNLTASQAVFSSSSKQLVSNPITGTGSVVMNASPTITTAALTNPTVTNYVETLYSANTSTAITVALTNGTVQNLTLTGNATITMPTAVAGKSFIIILSQDATGSRTVTWSTVSWPSATAPTITTTASKKDIYSFFSDGTSWYGTTIGQNYT
jgi:hypothetical protein